MTQCNYCKAVFADSVKLIVPDHTGFDDKKIEKCPCCGETIDENQFVFTNETKKILTYWADAFISQCNRQKTATNEIFLLEHYTKLISETQQLLKILTK